MNSLKHAFFWLSGAGAETLAQCPNWEQRKYAAFGATVLVPTLFAFIACSYAISTLTDNWLFIIPVSLVWSFIILTIDRALLSTYRSYQRFHRKFGQFSLRIVIAALMGITISHPLTLLLFKDTIQTVIEEEREQEIAEVRAGFAESKAEVFRTIEGVKAEIAEEREKYTQTYQAGFLEETLVSDEKPAVSELDPETRAALDQSIAEETAPLHAKIKEVESQILTMSRASSTPVTRPPRTRILELLCSRLMRAV